MCLLVVFMPYFWQGSVVIIQGTKLLIEFRNFYKPSFPLPLLVSCMIQRIQERDEQVLLEILSGLMDLLKNISAYADEEKNTESSIYAKVLSVWKDKVSCVIVHICV